MDRFIFYLLYRLYFKNPTKESKRKAYQEFSGYTVGKSYLTTSERFYRWLQIVNREYLNKSGKKAVEKSWKIKQLDYFNIILMLLITITLSVYVIDIFNPEVFNALLIFARTSFNDLSSIISILFLFSIILLVPIILLDFVTSLLAYKTKRSKK